MWKLKYTKEGQETVRHYNILQGRIDEGEVEM